MMLTKAKFCLVNELLGCFARYCRRVGGQNWPFKMFKREGSEKWPPRAFSLCSRNPEANEVKCGSFILKNSGQVQVADVSSAVAKNPRSMFEGHVLQSSSFSTPHSVHQRFYSSFFFSFFFTQSLFRMSGLPQLTASMATVHLVNKLCCAEDRTAQTCFYFDMPYFTSPKICALLFCFVFFKAATKCVRARFKDLIFRSRS